jgi:hypothetical protein
MTFVLMPGRCRSPPKSVARVHYLSNSAAHCIQCFGVFPTDWTRIGVDCQHSFMRRPPSVQKLSDRFGDYVLVITCRKRKHGRRTQPHAIAKLVGWDAALVKAAARLRCSNCGAKDCELTTDSIPRPRGVPKNPH